ncbi:MAG: endonuclease/exonuclease/phosphatase family protein [Pseudomonadota bacterium]
MPRPVLAILLIMLPLSAAAEGLVRFATYNASLNAREPGRILERLQTGTDEQAKRVAELIQRVRPQVLALQELDRDAAGDAVRIFAEQYLAVGQNGAEPIRYPFTVFPESNTGEPLGIDIDGDGRTDGPNDAKGFGYHPGQYAFALLSQHPIGAVRTFRNFLWRDIPQSLIPPAYYSAAARAVMPVSSKTHLAAEVDLPGGTVWAVVAHPTPPVFDDERDWNGRRNADEIRFLTDIATGADYPVDDAGVPGSIPPGAPFVIMGDLNADPDRGDSRKDAISPLLAHPRLWSQEPPGLSGVPTATFAGGLRVDYVLGSQNAGTATAAGVVRVPPGHEHSDLMEASDHFMVFVDIAIGEQFDTDAAFNPPPGPSLQAE